MKPVKLPPLARLKQVLEYDPNSGIMRNRETGRQFSLSTHGYRVGRVDGVEYRASRLAWKMMTGTEPLIMDHINGVKDDDRWENLRSVETKTNNCNRKISSRNTSGYTGVYWTARKRKWRATIKFDGKIIYLGYHRNIEDAAKARRTAEENLGYHKNHGRPY